MWKLMVATILIIAVLMSSCMPSPRSRWVLDNRPAGFFAGFWHGIIAFFTLILSLFTKITMYECYNNGFWYNLGFFIGMGGVSGGGTKVIFKKK